MICPDEIHCDLILNGGPRRPARIDYLRSNKEIVRRFINEEVEGLFLDGVEATYLAWIDTRALGLPDAARFFGQFGVAVYDGKDFAGEGFVRLNFACPRRLLLEALARLRRAVHSLGTSSLRDVQTPP